MPSNLAARRNATHLAPIQTSVSSNSRSASVERTSIPVNKSEHSTLKPNVKLETAPPTLPVADDKLAIPEPNLKPRHSRTALFDLFSKTNNDRMKDPSPARSASGSDQRASQAQPHMLQKPSRPTTQAGNHRDEVSEPRGLLRNAKSSKDLRSAKKKDENPKSQLKVHWRPPPLFQAYPQAIKHTSLEAPSTSSNLATSERQPRPATRENAATETQESGGKGHRLLDRMRSKSRLRDEFEKDTQRIGPSDSSRAWTRKVFVLVTSGYLLQYAGDGAFDRMPEKILKLGPESAAFASDALEGKHWVLQVLQTAKTEESGVRPTNKGFWSKIGMQTYSRREVSSMLLVFPTPDEMDSWRKAIRKLIGVDACTLAIETEPQSALKRYSSIVRHPSKEADLLSTIRATDSNHSSPTIYVPSLRDSGSTVVASESSFPSRKPPQSSPPLKPEGLRPISTISTRNSHMIIGPALKSPGFFERHQTPLTAEFPKSGYDGSLLRIPLTPPEPEVNLGRRWSLQSASSKSSLATGDVDTAGPRQSSVAHHPLPAVPSIFSSQRDSEPSTPSTPSLQSFPEPPKKAGMVNANEMEPIAESPPTSSHGANTSRQTSTSIEEVASTSSAQTSGAPPDSQIHPTSSGYSSKRTSVFARPLPVIPQPRTSNEASASTWADSGSSRTSVLNSPPISPELTRSYSDNQTLQSDGSQNIEEPRQGASGRSASQPPPKDLQNPSGPSSPSSPKASSANSPQDNPLRRPASLQIRSDYAPFLAAPRASTKTIATSAPRHIKGHSTADNRPSARTSQAMTGTRIRSSALHLHLPPLKPPPNMPLPAPPTQPPTST